MKRKFLHPNQIIALRDYPIRNEQILKIYFHIFQNNQGKIVPPCPVIHKSICTPFAKGGDIKSKRYNILLNRFFKRNPKAEFFLLDGSHRSSAAALACNLIPALIMENDEDFKRAHKLAASRELLGWHAPAKSVQETAKTLMKHHFGTKKFQTVEDKVKKMVSQKILPKYMISSYKKFRLQPIA